MKARRRRGRSHAPEARSRVTDAPRDAHDRLVVGYHACERTIARRVLLGKAELTPSTNDYDWLGTGIYFWEYGLTRARQFAEEKRQRGAIKDPFVLGAYVHLGQCLDLTDVWATHELAFYYEKLRATFGERALPVNRSLRGRRGEQLLRRLDCSVINLCLSVTDNRGRPTGKPFRFDTVRGAFEEGPPAFPGAAVREKSHVQFSVRNPACVVGVFRPTGYSL